MSWYYGTYSCGHEGRTQVYGPTKKRQWIADRRFEGLCPDCYKIKLEEDRTRANEEAARRAKEAGLPELTGTEKPIAWANTLRQEMMEKAEKEIEHHVNRYSADELKLYNALEYMLKTKKKASWYIEHRQKNIIDILEVLAKKIPTEKDTIEKELKTEAIVFPENKKHEKIAEIKLEEEVVAVYYPRNDDFYNIVKNDLGYRWKGSRWEKAINYKTGTIEDRAAELGNKLLNAGFPIMIMDEVARKKAIEAVYEPEHDLWIGAKVSGKYKGQFTITWAGYDDTMYQRARSLPGSRWSGFDVVIKAEYYKEIEEFAQLYNFKFSPGAVKLLNETKEKDRYIQENAVKVDPAESKEKLEHKDGLQEILESKEGILDDLKD
ncbi:MAG: hypothetical protein MI740_10590 [Halanaerobiales bacterium]|nr:hypothetical protein [Halanaerobiales bacterium]